MTAGMAPKWSHRYSATEDSQDLELGDSASDTDTLHSLEEKIDNISRTVDAGVDRIVEAAGRIDQKVEDLKNVRFTLDETTVRQLGAALRDEFSKTAEAIIESHSRAVGTNVATALGGQFFEQTRRAVAETPAADSALGKIAKVMAIAGGVIIAGMAATYGYAAANYQPPVTRVKVDGGLASASAMGGEAL